MPGKDPTEPAIIAVENVSIDATLGRWSIKTGWPTWGRRALDVYIHQIVDSNVGGNGTVVEGIRINLTSSTARDGILRGIKDQEREELKSFLGKVTTIMQTKIQSSRKSELVDGTEQPPPQEWILKPFWPATGATGLAAAPSSYKSFLALGAALQIATGKPVLQANTTTSKTGSVLYLDWEDNRATFLRRQRAICEGAGIPHGAYINYHRPMRSLSHSLEDLIDMVQRDQPTAIIVDSMSAAIDGSMNDSDVVNEFWNAVHALGVPTLVITHKSIENQKHRRAAFQGSGMSMARVRMAWNAEKSREGPVVWTCFKDNHGDGEGNRLAWDVRFHTEGENDLASVTIEGMKPNLVRLQDSTDEEKSTRREAVYQLISELLDNAGKEGMLPAEVAVQIGQAKSTATSRLSEMYAAERVTKIRSGKMVRYFHPPHASEKLDTGTQTDTEKRHENESLPDPW